MKVSHWMSCIAVGVGLLGALPAAAFEYRFSLLPTLGGEDAGALAINNAGQVAGWSRTSTYSYAWATVWTDGVPTGLPTPAGANGSYARGINDLGQVVGNSSGPDGPGRAILWNAGIPTELDQTGSLYSQATAINNRGQVVGETTNAPWRATLWEGASTIRLGTLYGVNASTASGINNLGQVVGTSTINITDPEYGSRSWEAPTLWHDGSVTDLGTLGGSGHGTGGALDINDAGQVVGWSGNITASQGHATLWSDGLITDLGTLGGGEYSVAQAINESGLVVGSSEDAARVSHATLWKGTTLIKLADLIDPASVPAGWTLREAMDINDHGVIVGLAVNPVPGNYQSLGFVLTPVPEPDTVVLLLAGLGLMAGAARRRWGVAGKTALAVPAASDETQLGRCRSSMT